MRSALLLIPTFLAGNSCIAQLQGQRLIARTAYYDTSGTGCCFQAYDSTALKYSGGRGSRFDWNQLDYFEPRLSRMTDQLSSIIRPNNIDSTQAAAPALFDTLRYYKFHPYLGVRLDRMETCDYYPDGTPFKITQFRPDVSDEIKPLFSQESIYFGRDLIRTRYKGLTPGADDDQQERFLVRDASANVVLDSTAMHSGGRFTAFVKRFEYDPAGRYINKGGGS